MHSALAFFRQQSTGLLSCADVHSLSGRGMATLFPISPLLLIASPIRRPVYVYQVALTSIPYVGSLVTQSTFKRQCGTQLGTSHHLNGQHRSFFYHYHLLELTIYTYIRRVNPHVIIRQTEGARTEERYRRTRLHIPAYVAVHEDRQPVGIGAHGAVPYREETPFTTYQQEARGQEVMVSEHYTSSFRSGVFVER